MPCANAMLTDVVSVQPDQTIAEAMAALDRHKIRYVPVVNADGIFQGHFSTHDLLKFLIPPSYFLAHVKWQLDFIMGATEDKARILEDLQQKKIQDVMTKDVVIVHPETPISEGIRLLFQEGIPLPVVERDGRLVGLVSEQSLLAHLKSVLHHKGE